MFETIHSEPGARLLRDRVYKLVIEDHKNNHAIQYRVKQEIIFKFGILHLCAHSHTTNHRSTHEH